MQVEKEMKNERLFRNASDESENSVIRLGVLLTKLQQFDDLIIDSQHLSRLNSFSDLISGTVELGVKLHITVLALFQ